MIRTSRSSRTVSALLWLADAASIGAIRAREPCRACSHAASFDRTSARCRAVLQIFGRMNKTIEGVPVEEGASYVNKYFLLPSNLKATDKITLSLDEGELEEGYYHMSAKVRMSQDVGCC